LNRKPIFALILFVSLTLLISSVFGSSVMWSQNYGTEEAEEGTSIVQTSDGGYALAGETLPSSGTVDFWLIKTDENGIIPEFSSATILALVLSTVLGVLIFRKKLDRSSKNN
jgi:hypothetical protein